MSHRFSEHTINGVTYRVEQEMQTGDWIIVGYWRCNDERQHVSMKVFGTDVEDEIEDNGLDRTFQNCEHAALRLGVTRLEPVVRARNERLIELDADRIYNPSDPDMDDQLADALRYGAPDWLQRERELERQYDIDRQRAVEMFAAEQAESARAERERQQEELKEMESSELWGAF